MGERAAAVGRKVKNTIGKLPLFKIHPAIGIARVGNADPGQFFIGPELPGLPASPPGGNFKVGGKLRKQAARFRIFEYKPDKASGKLVPEEVTIATPYIQSIEWTVHVANRKASYYEFHGLLGSPAPPYAGADLRNASVTDPAKRKTELEIDPGPKSIGLLGAGAPPGAKPPSSTGTIHIVKKGEYLVLIAKNHGIADWHEIYNHPMNAAFKKKRPDPNLIYPGDELFIPTGAAPSFGNSNATIPISTLGELRTDAKGRLLVLGGNGTSESNKSGGREVLDSFCNNDTWFDDVSDGPVSARITLKTGKSVSAVSAWVLITPPDFAPPIGNVITLYDTLYDVAVQSSAAAFNVPADLAIYDRKPLERYRDLKTNRPTYKPSFTEDIFPILKRTIDQQFVHEPASFFHNTLVDFAKLSKTTPAAPPNPRASIFAFMRKRGGGGGSMPKLLGDEAEEDATRGITSTHPEARLAMTATQLELMEKWAKGDFIDDWPGSPPPKPAAREEGIAPEDIDRAALENCVGGAFYPGIEVGWLIRHPDIYGEPFRIAFDPILQRGKVLGADARTREYTVGAGYFSQQMALPWQADFHDCQIENHDSEDWGWWPGQRPDHAPATGGGLNPWTRATPGPWPSGDPNDCSREEMVDHFWKLGFVKEDPAQPGKYIEGERAAAVP